MRHNNFLQYVLFLVLLGQTVFQFNQHLYGGVSASKDMAERSDMEVIQALGSRNYQESLRAKDEIVRRGEKMIPLLLKNQGDHRSYTGGGLGKETAAWAFLSSEEGKIPKGFNRLVLPVQIASLYIISGIYFGRLDFAEGPVLTFKARADRERKIINNNRKMIKRAYKAYAKWAEKVKTEGLETIRQRQEPPLAGTEFHWW